MLVNWISMVFPIVFPRTGWTTIMLIFRFSYCHGVKNYNCNNKIKKTSKPHESFPSSRNDLALPFAFLLYYVCCSTLFLSLLVLPLVVGFQRTNFETSFFILWQTHWLIWRILLSLTFVDVFVRFAFNTRPGTLYLQETF